MRPFSSLGCSLHSSSAAAYNVSEQLKMVDRLPMAAGTEVPAKETMPGGPGAEERAPLHEGRDGHRTHRRNGRLQRL